MRALSKLAFITGIATLLCVVCSSFATAQTSFKHPRVAEVESKLSEETFNYLKGRFPSLPVLVKVEIEPLRRNQIQNRASTDESLPFMSYEGLEIKDEWDDPNRTVHELFSRIQRATVSISLPDSVGDAEIIELREALYNVLHLVPGRDKIDCTRRDWQIGPSWWRDIAMFAPIPFVLIALLGLFFILRNGIGHVSSAIRSVAAQQQSNATPPPIRPPETTIPQTDHKKSSRGDIQFNDPLKLKEHVRTIVDSLVNDPTFPTLEDMITLHDKAKEDPQLLGAAMAELPIALQKQLFALSYGHRWLAAMHDPGDLNIGSYELLHKLAQNRQQIEDPQWEELLVHVWRLKNSLPDFLRSLGQDDGIALLANMPSHLSIPTGKKAFPGSWGVLLDPEFKPPKPNNQKQQELKKMALNLKPLNDHKMLATYKHEKGLLTYLKTATVAEEREIYEASKPDSVIHRIRPPFYKIFAQTDEISEKLVARFAIDIWAYALFNAPRADRKKMERVMSDKQKFLLLEGLKSLDGQRIDREQVGLAREAIGSALAVILANSEAASESNLTVDKYDDDPEVAA